MCLTRRVALMLALTALLAAIPAANADEFYLANHRTFPGQLWLSRNAAAEQSLFRREAITNPAFAGGTTKLGQVAIGPDGKIYYASGLDGYVLHLQDGRHEIVSTQASGQVRDLACTGEEHTVYYSVVATPQNGEPLADGKIYRRDFWEGSASEVATIRQADLGDNWWGTFAIRNGVIIAATLDQPSRLFEITPNGAVQIHTDNTLKIHGLASGADGNLYASDATRTIHRLTTSSSPEVAFQASREFTEIALPAVAGSPGP